jgi:uncharacterized membrane protein
LYEARARLKCLPCKRRLKLHFAPAKLHFVAINWLSDARQGTLQSIHNLERKMHDLLKSLHLLGVCLFIGNIIVSGFWKTMADRVDDLAVARFSTRLVNLTDALFTGLGATLLMVAGHAMAGKYGGIGANPWIVWSYGAFGLSGILWIAVLVPIQIRQRRLLQTTSTSVPADYKRLARIWSIVGVVATIVALPPLFWMVARPV